MRSQRTAAQAVAGVSESNLCAGSAAATHSAGRHLVRLLDMLLLVMPMHQAGLEAER